MNKLLTFIFLSLFLISFTSALDIQSVSLEKVGLDWDNIDQFTKDATTSAYGRYEIRNSVLGIPFLQLSKVADIELIENSDSCGIDCYAEKEITLYNDGILIDENGIIFKTEQTDGSWIEQDIRNFQFKTWDSPLSRIETSYKERCSGNYTDEETDTFYPLVCEDVRTDTTIYYKLIDTYKTVCVDDKDAKANINGTIPQTCSQVFDKKIEQVYDGYTNYEMGEVVKAGTYNLRLEGEKKPSRTVDWIVKTNGVWTDNWAVWGASNLEENQVAQYKSNTQAFGTNNQSIALDSTGLNDGTWSGKTFNDGTVSGGVTIDDDAMVFDGVDGKITNINGINQGFNNPITYSTWIKLNSDGIESGASQPVITSDSSYIQIRGLSNSVNIRYDNSVEGAIIISYDLGNGDRNYHHIVAYYDGISTLMLYIDGISVGNKTSTTIGNTSYYNAGIGNAGSGYFNGSISTTQIYNKALTQEQITEIYNAGKDSYTPVGDGLVAQYSGRDFEGTTANPTTIYDTNQLVDGKINEAFTFDGVDDYIVSTENSNFNATMDKSVSVWFKSNKDGTNIYNSQTIIQIPYLYVHIRDTSNNIQLRYDDGSAKTSGFILGNGDRDLHHLTGTFSSNGTNSNLTLYVDGVLKASNSWATIPVTAYSSKINIGRRDSGSFDGSIDDVRIFNRSLTQDEITTLYNDGAGTEETVNGVITLNSPTDNAIAYNNPVTFSASAEVSGGATLTNMTLYNNIGGSWEANGTETLNNLIISDNQEMCGTYTGYANIIINNTATITICDYNGTSGTGELTLHAYNDVTIESGVTINGTGKGYTGGAAPTNTNGNNGNGDGNGLGGYYDTIGTQYAGGGSGAGGYAIGGYGGGSPDVPSSNRKAGGIAYQTSGIKESYIGSGGGSGADFGIANPGRAGARGGASITITARDINVKGTLIVDGNNAIDASIDGTANAGSGGGSPGSISIIGDNVDISSASLSSDGGDGGNGYSTSAWMGQGGGGASGGLIDIYYKTTLDITSLTSSVTGGALGTADTEAGFEADDGQAGNSGLLVYNEETYVAPSYTLPYNTSQITSSTQTWNRTITGPTSWNVEACDSDGDCGFSSANFTVFLDEEAPSINITAPINTLNYNYIGGNETLNVTFTDTNLDSCWYNYNGTNVTIEGCLNSSKFILESSNTNLTVYANDSLGNLNSEFVEWDYTLLEISQSYSSTVQEGSSSLISSNVTFEASKRISSVILNYNGTGLAGDYIEFDTNTYYISKSKIIPNVEADTNVTFFWNVTLEDGSSQETASRNQTISNLGIDNCDLYTNMLFNFTIVDEKTQAILDGSTENTTLRYSMTLANPTSGEAILNFSELYTNTNPSAICMETPIGDSEFNLDAIVEYSANDKFIEFYNIKDYSLTNSTDEQNITLYNLNESQGQEFKITYKDSNFNTIPGALIQIQRKYIDEGIFKTVEIPMVGSAGYTIAHLVRNDIIYNLIIISGGEVVASFDNIVADCQNPTFTECVININSFSTGTEPSDFTNDGEFTAVLSYDKDTRAVSTTYAIVSGVPATTNLNVNLWNAYANTSVCTDSLNAAGGTLSCIVPESFGNSTISISLSSDGDVKRTATINLAQDPNDIYGSNLIFIGLTIMLLIIGMSISDNPVMLGVMLIIGVIVLTVMNITVGAGWIGGGATILWFIIAVIMLLVKGSNRQ